MGFQIQLRYEDTQAFLVIGDQIHSGLITPGAIGEALAQLKLPNSPTTQKKIEKICTQYASAPQSGEHLLMQSKAPIHGTDGALYWQPGFGPEGETHSTQEDGLQPGEGRVDFYNALSYTSITQDTHIATIQYATPGEDGMSLFGKPLRAKPGKPIEFSFCEASVQIDAQGRVLALIDGVLQQDDRSLKVCRMLQVSEYVDFSTGNVDYDGSIEVRKGVRDRFKLNATESIIIHGLVESAEIRCGGNFICHQGMAAKEQGLIEVGGDAEVGYLNQVKGSIRGNLVFRNELMTCDMVVGGSIRGTQGSIVGGSIQIGEGAAVGSLGTESELETLIVLGSIPFLSERDVELKGAIETLESKLEQSSHAIQTLSKNLSSLSAAQREELTLLQFEHNALDSQLQKLRDERETCQSNMAASRAHTLHVGSIIHANTRFKTCEGIVRFEQSLKGPVNLGWNEHNQLQYKHSDGVIHSLHRVTQLQLKKAG